MRKSSFSLCFSAPPPYLSQHTHSAVFIVFSPKAFGSFMSIKKSTHFLLSMHVVRFWMQSDVLTHRPASWQSGPGRLHLYTHTNAHTHLLLREEASPLHHSSLPESLSPWGHPTTSPLKRLSTAAPQWLRSAAVSISKLSFCIGRGETEWQQQHGHKHSPYPLPCSFAPYFQTSGRG